MWSTASAVRCDVAIGAALGVKRVGRGSTVTTSRRMERWKIATPKTRNLGARIAFTTRATPNDDDPSLDRTYYENWAKYPDDPSVPSEITELLREVGDGEVSMWSSKPPWCQPWTILLTGSLIVAAPTTVLHLKWLSVLFALPIAVWWYLFLVLAPKQYVDYVETARQYYERR